MYKDTPIYKDPLYIGMPLYIRIPLYRRIPQYIRMSLYIGIPTRSTANANPVRACFFCYRAFNRIHMLFSIHNLAFSLTRELILVSHLFTFSLSPSFSHSLSHYLPRSLSLSSSISLSISLSLSPYWGPISVSKRFFS